MRSIGWRPWPDRLAAAVCIERGRGLSITIETADAWRECRSALARFAADAFARYGKGRHPAGLNFGDRFASALARSLDAPLLFEGNDFSRTDVRHAGP